LDVYLGRNTGHRVLDGVIERGSGETINAVIWFCDLWNFTGISENLRTDWTIAVLNDYFEAVGEPVEEQDGEILKFIGDAILAIFPLKNLVAAEVAGRALKAASAARQRMAELNQRRAGEGKPPLDFGLSLHVGDVIYGNIGAPKRLDFTVIGPAVNMVTRIEGLTKELKQPILVSRDFAALAGAENFASQGTFELKGIEGKREVLAPRRLPDPPARPTSQVTFNSVV
jgi:adenylate cyclase